MLWFNWKLMFWFVVHIILAFCRGGCLLVDAFINILKLELRRQSAEFPLPSQRYSTMNNNNQKPFTFTLIPSNNLRNKMTQKNVNIFHYFNCLNDLARYFSHPFPPHSKCFRRSSKNNFVLFVVVGLFPVLHQSHYYYTASNNPHKVSSWKIVVFVFRIHHLSSFFAWLFFFYLCLSHSHHGNGNYTMLFCVRCKKKTRKKDGNSKIRMTFECFHNECFVALLLVIHTRFRRSFSLTSSPCHITCV